MRHFPVDAPKSQAIKTLERLGVRVIREGNHISMIRENPDGSRTSLTMPNHRRIKESALRRICNQSDISKNDFLEAYSQV